MGGGVADRRQDGATAALFDAALTVTVQAPQKARRDSLSLHCGTANRPHPHKAAKGGEDAVFADAATGVLGVADGVGSWARKGIDAGLYSKELLARTATAMRRDAVGPMSALTEAYEETSALGSATAVVARLRADSSNTAVLDICAVGDAQLRVYREGALIAATVPKQYAFNTPMQLGTGSRDRPCDGESVSFGGLMAGDTIVAASDGLWDNLFDEEVATVVGAFTRNPSAAAEALATAAHNAAAETTRRSPFSVEAEAWGWRYVGGKMDDCGLAVAVVV